MAAIPILRSSKNSPIAIDESQVTNAQTSHRVVRLKSAYFVKGGDAIESRAEEICQYYLPFGRHSNNEAYGIATASQGDKEPRSFLIVEAFHLRTAL
ncbi:hypothetical protein BQ8794_200285 [Mesorhizobium prunaredense]|uniref:Uncharacterized protein n=1 Tax=Mesorhizobium prunaredense TaxID=1631249 RepID=A0A1R3V5Y2_9HYPH|nr:hypothetical protein BQ8794_200285 [Mesorhizobium prunaredense]